MGGVNWMPIDLQKYMKEARCGRDNHGGSWEFRSAPATGMIPPNRRARFSETADDARDLKDIGRTQRDDLAVTCCDHAVNFATVRQRTTRPVPAAVIGDSAALLRKSRVASSRLCSYSRANSIRFPWALQARIQAIAVTRE